MYLIEGVGGPWTLEGGDLVRGFGIGNADVPIFVGGGWSGDSGPPNSARCPMGAFIDRFLVSSSVCSSYLAIQCHSVLLPPAI